MTMELTILGTSAATPTRQRDHSGQFMQFGSQSILIDSGGGGANQNDQIGIKLSANQPYFHKSPSRRSLSGHFCPD